MIVDSPMNVGLAVGQDRRIMQEGDAQLLIPPVIAPVLLALQPLTSMPGQNERPQTSFLWSAQFQLTGPVASSEPRVCILSKGLWELELTIASNFSFSEPFFQIPAAFTLNYQGNLSMKLLARWVTLGNFTDYNRLRILLQSDADLNTLLPVINAAHFGQLWFTVNAIRIL